MYNILVVDDEPEIVKVLDEFLTRNGFNVIKAMGGSAALKVLSSVAVIDLMILDIKMRHISGMDVLRELERLNRKVPVIILTGSINTEKYLDDLSKLGFDENDIFYKPEDLYLILDVIKNKLQIKS